MRLTHSILTGLILFALVLAPTQIMAADKAAKVKKEKPAPVAKAPSLRGPYAVYAKAANLSEDQTVKIIGASEKRNASHVALKDEWTKAREAYLAARKGDDKSAITQTKEAYDKVNAKRAKINADFDVDIRKALKADQVLAWEKAKLDFGVASGYSRFNLTAEQQKKVDALVAETAAAMAKADPSDAKAYDAPRTELFRTLRKDIVTDEQRAAVKAAPKAKAPAKPAAKAAAKPKTKSKKKDDADDAGDTDDSSGM